MKKLRFNISVVVLSTIVLTFLACAEKDAAEENKTDKNNGITTTFISGNDETASAKTRTSLDYAAEKWFWEAGDKIYVKDRDGNWQVSNAVTAHTENFTFKLPGMYSPTGTMVYYLGKNGTNNQITIPTTQNQTKPNAIDEISNNGECGVAEAVPQWKADGLAFKFKLKHPEAILALQPYTQDNRLKTCKITKIDIISNNDIAGTFTLSSLGLTGAGSKQIRLETKSDASGAYPDGFPLNNTAASLATNGCFIVIKPGTHTLTIRYWVKDAVNNIEGTVTQSYPAFTYAANSYYDMEAPLKIKAYAGNSYYSWDAQQNFWSGYEWNSANPKQPTKDNYGSSTQILTYPYIPKQDGTDARSYNKAAVDAGLDAQTPLFQTLPNVNELCWYSFEGDPHWDSSELWTMMGKLYKGGLWLKKKATIMRDHHITDPNYLKNGAIDHFGNYVDFHDGTKRTPQQARPSHDIVPNAFDYFFLPATGYYDWGAGWFYGIGRNGTYWQQSITINGSSKYCAPFEFDADYVYLSSNMYMDFQYGLRAQPFE